MHTQICVFKAQGDVKREAEELNGLLRQYPAEVSSWLELGELYLTLGDNTVRGVYSGELVFLLLYRMCTVQ